MFLPTDFAGWDEQAKRLKNTVIDFELRKWLKDIRGNGARVWAIVDCCYSGTIARGLAVPRKVDERDLRLAIPREAFVEAQRRGSQNPAAGEETVHPGPDRRARARRRLRLPADRDDVRGSAPVLPKGREAGAEVPTGS